MVDTAAAIADLYKKELGRAGSTEEIAPWISAVEAGTSLSDIQNQIARSQEGVNYDINRLYQSELSRAPDQGGIQIYAPALASGQMSESDLLKALRSSQEYGNLALQQYKDVLTQQYLNELGRAPDDAGLLNWARSLRAGEIQTSQLPSLISGSSEGYVFDLYKDLFNRTPDFTGAQGWINALESGQMTREQLAEALKASEEYKSFQAKQAEIDRQKAIDAKRKQEMEAANLYYKPDAATLSGVVPFKPFVDPTVTAPNLPTTQQPQISGFEPVMPNLPNQNIFPPQGMNVPGGTNKGFFSSMFPPAPMAGSLGQNMLAPQQPATTQFYGNVGLK